MARARGLRLKPRACDELAAGA